MNVDNSNTRENTPDLVAAITPRFITQEERTESMTDLDNDND